jgi:hypothetical protein
MLEISIDVMYCSRVSIHTSIPISKPRRIKGLNLLIDVSMLHRLDLSDVGVGPEGDVDGHLGQRLTDQESAHAAKSNRNRSIVTDGWCSF